MAVPIAEDNQPIAELEDSPSSANEDMSDPRMRGPGNFWRQCDSKLYKQQHTISLHKDLEVKYSSALLGRESILGVQNC